MPPPEICGFAQAISHFHVGRCFPAPGRCGKVLRRCQPGFFTGRNRFAAVAGRLRLKNIAFRSAKAVGGWHKPAAAGEIRPGTG